MGTDIENELNTLKITYRGELAEKTGMIMKAIKNSDWQQLEHLVHKLAGSSGTYGFSELSAHLRNLEDRLLEKKIQTQPENQIKLELKTWTATLGKLCKEAKS